MFGTCPLLRVQTQGKVETRCYKGGETKETAIAAGTQGAARGRANLDVK